MTAPLSLAAHVAIGLAFAYALRVLLLIDGVPLWALAVVILAPVAQGWLGRWRKRGTDERERAARICDVLAARLRAGAPDAATTIATVEALARMIRSGGAP